MNIKTVLIVDDEPSNLEILVNHLQNLEYTVLMTNNAQKAFEISEKRTPDVVITDWEMPDINGIEFIKMLKKSKITSDIPVIMCTGVMMSSENLQTALDAGAVDYIRKPVDEVELTARLNSAIRLSESLKEIKLLNENKDKMFEIIAHDLTGPVGHIYSILDPQFIKVLSSEKLKEFLIDARASISSTYSLLKNLLLWARSQRNKQNFLPKLYDLNLIINENINLLSDSAKYKNIKLIWNYTDECFALFDKNMILTVVRNLVANAIKFTPEGGKITIATKNETDFIKISVSDTGTGVSAENVEKILKGISFTNYGTNREKGSGLGLQLCLDFINKNNGDFWIESEEGKGSCFCFSLPIN